MIKRDIALRYSKVLFNLDLTKNYLNNRLNEFEFIGQLMKYNVQFFQFLKSPSISLQQKKELLEDSLKDVLELNFLYFLIYLIEKKHLEYLELIASEYRNLVNEYYGIWETEMIIPLPIEPNLEKKLINKLENFFQKKIKIHTKVQPEIIGGAILIMADTMIDWSIASRLKKMKESLLEIKNDI